MADASPIGPQLLPELAKAAGALESYHVTHFRLYRERRNGSGVQTVDVEVYDAGPGSRNRYSVHAKSDDGRAATGNPAERIDVVLATVHWGDLDRE